MMVAVVLWRDVNALGYEALPGTSNKRLRETLVLCVQDGFV